MTRARTVFECGDGLESDAELVRVEEARVVVQELDVLAVISG
jgi:hypothetical protein